MCGEVVVPEDHLDVSNYPISSLSQVKRCNKYRSRSSVVFRTLGSYMESAILFGNYSYKKNIL